MGRFRHHEFADWVKSGGRKRFGELLMEGNEVFSYAMRIAVVLRNRKIVILNAKADGGVSCTTTRHSKAVSLGMHWLTASDPGYLFFCVEDSLFNRYLIHGPEEEVDFDLESYFANKWGISDEAIKSGLDLDFMSMLRFVMSKEDLKSQSDTIMAEYLSAGREKREAMRGLYELASESE